MEKQVMSVERTLWDLPETSIPEPDKKKVEMDRVRRDSIKRLRGNGHWTTVVRVARSIAQPFTLNDISVAVWRACPEFFGMKGYPYPDNHKVHYILYGDRGLIAKGIIERVSQGLFKMPDGAEIERGQE
jgi:hypothetical protein